MLRNCVLLVLCVLVLPVISRAERPSINLGESGEITRDSITIAAQDSTSLAIEAKRQTGVVSPGLFDMITNLPSDWSGYFKKTVTWDHWLPITAMAIGTTALVMTDHESYVPFKKVYDKNQTFHDAMDYCVFMGDGKFQFGIAALFAGYSIVSGNQKAWRTASQTAEVILSCGAVVQVLKHLTGRESPFVATSWSGKWILFPNQIDYMKHTPHYDAFPSGHIATATATLTVIANNYPDSKWILPVGYVALGGIATGLCASGIHWWSDIPLGVALGYGFAQVVTANNAPDTPSNNGEQGSTEPLEKSANGKGLQFSPMIGADYAGVSMAWHF